MTDAQLDERLRAVEQELASLCTLVKEGNKHATDLIKHQQTIIAKHVLILDGTEETDGLRTRVRLIETFVGRCKVALGVTLTALVGILFDSVRSYLGWWQK